MLYRPVHQYVEDNSNFVVALISALLAPAKIVNVPFSAIHDDLSSSKYEMAYLSTMNVAFFASPGLRWTLLNPFNSLTGRLMEDSSSAT